MPEYTKPTTPKGTSASQERPTATAAEIQNALNQTAIQEFSERPPLEFRVITTENTKS